MTKYADLADLPENDRIKAIGNLAMKVRSSASSSRPKARRTAT